MSYVIIAGAHFFTFQPPREGVDWSVLLLQAVEGSELKGCWLDVVFFLLGVWWPMRSVENGPQVNNQLWTLHHSVPFGAGEETLDYGGEKRCVDLYV